MKVVAARLERHYNAVLIKTVGIDGGQAHHWFDEVDYKTIVYGGSMNYFHDQRKGETVRVPMNSETTVPKKDLIHYAEMNGYHVIEE